MEPNRKELTQSGRISFPIESGLTSSQSGLGVTSSSSESNKSSKSPKKNRRRVDLRVTLHGHKFRLQAYEDTPDGQLLLWLKSLPKRERDEKIMEALRLCYYPYALAWARDQGEDITVEEIQRAARGSLNQLTTQMERNQFFLIHDHQNSDPQQEIKDWETARALVKARLGEHEYNYLSKGGTV
jgi:hypothetical protein